jgi:hypothetical protein
MSARRQYFGGNEGALYDCVRQHLLDQSSSAAAVLPDDDGALRESVLSSFSLDSTKAKAAEMDGGFQQYDKESQIHGDHVSFDGKQGAWRQLDAQGHLPAQFKALLAADLNHVLSEFGYQTEQVASE